jgi:mono/diheme cytochrome c family protein
VALAALLLTIPGCDRNQGPSPADGAQASPEAYTAWWKGDAAASDAGTAAAPAKAGWAKLGPVKAELAKQGAEVFAAKCASCHSVGRGQVVGPDLQGLTARVEPDWARAFMQDPAPMLERDPHAKEMLAKYLVKMPNLQLTPAQLDALTEFLRKE